MSLTSIPYFEEEALIAIFSELDARDTVHPLLRLFPRQRYRGNRIKIRRMSRKPGAIRHVAMDGEAMPVKRGDLTVDEYEPTFLKVFDTLSQEDIALFTAADQERTERKGDLGPIQDEANRRIMMIAQALRDDTVEERHRLCAGALQGSISYRLGDMTSDLTVSYNLTSLSAPGTTWSSNGAKIPVDVLSWIEEARDANPWGRSPNTVFYNPKAYKSYFLENTEWQAWKKQNEELAKGFLGIAGGARESDFLGRVTGLFGMNWVPIEGTYRPLGGGSNVERWPVDKLVFANVDPIMYQPPATAEVRAAQRAQSPFEWAMCATSYNPNADLAFAFEGPTRADVHSWKAFCFDNGLPVLRDPSLVMPVDVVP